MKRQKNNKIMITSTHTQSGTAVKQNKKKAWLCAEEAYCKNALSFFKLHADQP